MAQNWDAPPPPPPPPGPPPPGPSSSHKPAPMSQQLSNKNAAYLAKMRAKQKQRASFNPPGPAVFEEPKKINLFGGNFLQNAKIENAKKKQSSQAANTSSQPKKSSKYVQLPDTGLTEKQLFEKYRIESNAKIGQGAFARIKVVKSISDDTKYALKMVKKKGKSRADIEAFKKEILYLSKLTNHPNIIKMYDFCDSAQGLYMVLEFCNGGDVMQRMELVKMFSEAEAKHVCKQIVAGLCYFHEFNIVHRDLKLDNLMFSNGVLKIIDFGLAGDCTNGALNTPCGTIHFTAPEVLSSYDYTTCADMWSLGVIIYLLICGFPPFFDNQGNEQKLYLLIKRAKFSFIKMYFDQCDPSLKELITDLLKKRPVERLTAQEVRKSEWFTGIKQPKKKVLVMDNPFLDDKKVSEEVVNPFLNKKDDKPKQAMAPYMQCQQAVKKQQESRDFYQKVNLANMQLDQQKKQNVENVENVGNVGQQQPGGYGQQGQMQQRQQQNGYQYQGYQMQNQNQNINQNQNQNQPGAYNQNQGQGQGQGQGQQQWGYGQRPGPGGGYGNYQGYNAPPPPGSK